MIDKKHRKVWRIERRILFLALFVSLVFGGTIYAQIRFPSGFAVAIDDMGWNEGGSLGDTGGPWRVGVRRNFDVRDYRPIVEVGRKVGVRFQGLFILSEMDRLNLLQDYPTTTQQGENFDNTANIDPSQFAMMDYVKENAAFLEFGLHGVGHEHWIDGNRTRAEWYNIEDNKPWPEEDMRDHIEAFKRIMAQYNLSPEYGHSFPESFVPCAYGYYWNPGGEYSTGALMRENGVKYANTLFQQIEELNPPDPGSGGIDHGVLVVDRQNFGNPWYALASLPTAPIDSFRTDIVESHWSNWLAHDDFLQEELNERWVNFFEEVQQSARFYLAKNTEQFASQWLYKQYATVIEPTEGTVRIDNREMPKEVYTNNLLGNMVLAVALEAEQHVCSATLDSQPIAAYYEAGGFGFLYLPKLDRDRYELRYSLGKERIRPSINLTGTYNVYAWEPGKKQSAIDLQMYGTQEVEIYTDRSPAEITSQNPHLVVRDYRYSDDKQVLSMTIAGRDIQGERGTIIIKH